MPICVTRAHITTFLHTGVKKKNICEMTHCIKTDKIDAQINK